MSKTSSLSRRAVLKGAGAAGAGLVIGTYLPFKKKRALAAGLEASAQAPFAPNAFIRIGTDSLVTVMIRNIEFGQGPATGLATLVAEELDADWSQIRAELAPADPAYVNEFFGMQGTGGSTAIASGFMTMRKAGAAARSMLVDAAAKAWSVPAAEITVINGEIAHASGKKGSFGEFAAAAAAETLPKDPSLKDPSKWTLIGKDNLPKVDSAAKSRGQTRFTLDHYPENAAIAVVAHPPAFGATPQSVDDSKARAVPGVLEVITIPSGVAVVAKDTYAALRGRDALVVQWDMSKAEQRSTETLFNQALELARKPGVQALAEGNVDGAFTPAHKIIEAEFQFPLLAHAPMEPLDAVIEVREGEVEYWAGAQFPGGDQMAIAKIFGLDPSKVRVNVEYAGGSFGRRATAGMEFAVEVAMIAKAWGTKSPLRVMWTRVDDIKGGFYRPLTVHRIRASVDAAGNIAGWDQVSAGQSLFEGTTMETNGVKGGIDSAMIEGLKEITYQLPNRRLSAHILKTGIPTLWWRSVGHTHTAYALEVMIDELLGLGGKDAIQGRLDIMGKEPRDVGVLRKVAEMAQWNGAKVGTDRARGVAVHKSFRSHVAQIVELSKGTDGMPKVHKVWCAVDCGIAVNPDIIRAQMEGGIGYGLSAALYSEINIDEGGIVRESNFNDYRSLRIDEAPEIHVEIIQSSEAPTGVGEPGVPPIAPALANAWRALTGQKIRRLPFVRTILEGK